MGHDGSEPGPDMPHPSAVVQRQTQLVQGLLAGIRTVLLVHAGLARLPAANRMQPLRKRFPVETGPPIRNSALIFPFLLHGISVHTQEPIRTASAR
jgi:hypothetical protein